MIHARQKEALRETAVVALAFVGMLGALRGCTDCTPPASDPAKEAAAEGAYLAEQLSCVERYESNAEIDQCRDAVKARWSRDGGQ